MPVALRGNALAGKHTGTRKRDQATGDSIALSIVWRSPKYHGVAMKKPSRTSSEKCPRVNQSRKRLSVSVDKWLILFGV